MTRRRWTVVGGLLLVVLVCAGAVFLTSRRARRPVPEVSLEGGGLQVEGQLAGGCVVEMLPPRFEPAAFVALPPGGYEVVLAGPRPDEIGITVYQAADGRPGGSLASTGLMPAARRSAWQPPQEAGGDIIMEVYAGRGDSDCWLFWFPLTLE